MSIQKVSVVFVLAFFSTILFAADYTLSQTTQSGQLQVTAQSNSLAAPQNQNQNQTPPPSQIQRQSQTLPQNQTPNTASSMVSPSSKPEQPVIVSSPSKIEGPVIVKSTLPIPSNSNNSMASAPPTQAVQQTSVQTQTQIQQPGMPVPVQRVLTIDMEGKGNVDVESLQQGKAALLVLRVNANERAYGMGIFRDQMGDRYRALKGIEDLANLMGLDNDIGEGNALYDRLRLAYILLNGRIQTVTLSDAKISVIHIGNASSVSSTGMVDAFVLGTDNINRSMQEVIWKGYLE